MSATPPRSAAGQEEQELGIAEALAYATQLHRNRQLDAAETLYRRVLAAVPEQPDALHFLALLRFQRGRPEEAVELLARAIAQAPDFADFHGNLGNIHTSLGRIEEATASYQRAIALDPQRADFHNNMGVLQRVIGDHAAAEGELLRAVELDPQHFRAHNNLGMLYATQERIEEAVQHYCRSITLMPSHPDGHKLLGLAYYSIGRIAEAAEVFRQWLVQEPNNPTARHLYAACSGQDVPQRAPDDYIVETFDKFAESFEEQLTSRLSYKAPELIVAALARHLPPPDKRFRILDAGCGTGLCGPLLAAHAAALTGVDLSVGMLEKAEGKACYDHLYRIELTRFLNMPDEAAAWDVIVSADTLCYFGPLDAVCRAARAALRGGGWLAFSLEDGGERAQAVGHVINPHGRYAHSAEYAGRCLREAGLIVIDIAQATLRTEGGRPVAGLLVVGRVPDATDGGGSAVDFPGPGGALARPA
ncbi:MAG: tetratricopeptide repeat protein [Candidatus Accumulibacter sp.]|uniref:tetratricopeptide repeat protein n=1 Tax=Accumulibacter sp. TaxID=2053492 RepID=UPI00287B4945|nr:tetratricopeptide repeat protein [Accumulibacter sp.]MDS4014043.1 tetratricopeptide repeat protein [Accumulibacter sp.]